MTRAIQVAKPALIGVIAVAGVVWLIRRARRPKGPKWLQQPSERSVLAEAARAATLSLASAAARKLAEHYLGVAEAGAAASGAQNDHSHPRSRFD